MADDNGLYAKIAEDVSETLEADSRGATTEQNPLLQKLKGAITKAVQTKVDYILQDVQKFSDHAKLYLYLQLPSGPSSGEKNLDLASLSSAEHMHACTWIRNHLEEYPDTCLPKQDVYDAYKRYCDNLCSRSLSAANFGKIIREIFPNIKARRLGGRGQSKYPSVSGRPQELWIGASGLHASCRTSGSGIRRKTVVNMPPLPSLDLKETETPERADLVQSYNDDVMDAACALTCDWAEKILKRSFNNIVEVAQFLIQQHIISSRSAHADLVMAMVVSEGGENHKEKRLPPSAKKNETEAPENAAKTQPQVKKETSPKPSAAPPRSEAKKPTDAPAKQASSPQVNALVARLPFLLPRNPVQPGGVVSPGASAVHASPPVLAPKLTAAPVGSAVKMALSVGATTSPLPLSLAPMVNGPSGLISPQGSVPVLNMILPSVTVPPVAEIPPKLKGAPTGGGVNGCEAGRSPQEPPKAKALSKRPAELPSEAGVVKRKRGRPRKKLDEPEPLVPEKNAAERGSSSLKDDSDIIVVTVGYGDHAASPSLHRELQEESSEVEVVHMRDARGAPPRDASGEGPSVASSHGVGDATKANILPSQVSVIKGRKSAVPLMVKDAGMGSPETGSGSREAVRFGHGTPEPGTGTRTTTARDSQKLERRHSFESDPQPTDLSLNKSGPPSSKDHPDDSGLRASLVRLYRLGTGQGRPAEAPSLSVTSTQAPSR